MNILETGRGKGCGDAGNKEKKLLLERKKSAGKTQREEGADRTGLYLSR